MFGALSYVPLFVQTALGGTATEAGQRAVAAAARMGQHVGRDGADAAADGAPAAHPDRTGARDCSGSSGLATASHESTRLRRSTSTSA